MFALKVFNEKENRWAEFVGYEPVKCMTGTEVKHYHCFRVDRNLSYRWMNSDNDFRLCKKYKTIRGANRAMKIIQNDWHHWDTIEVIEVA